MKAYANMLSSEGFRALVGCTGYTSYSTTGLAQPRVMQKLAICTMLGRTALHG